jgi:hypothetical protein
MDGQISSSYWSKKLQYANALDWLSGSNKGKELIAADEQGKFADAQRIASQRLQEHEGIVGKDNAELITDLLSIAQASMNKGDYAQAATVLDRASGLAKTARSGIATFQKWKLSQALAP